MQRARLRQPDVAVDARAFVPPALGRGRVDAHGDDVAAAVVQVVGDVDAEARVAARLAMQEVAVDPDDAVAEHAVELERDAPAACRRRERELAPVPADAVLRERAADRLRAVWRAAAFAERQFHRPVVRQIDAAPRAVLEVGRRRAVAVAGLAEEEQSRAVIEVLRRVEGVAEREAPAVVDAGARARTVGRGGAAGAECEREGPAEEGSVIHPVVAPDAGAGQTGTRVTRQLPA